MSEELIISIPEHELFNNDTMEFIHVKATKLVLKHSLLSLSKWESKWKKPFLEQNKERTREQMIDYVKCMTLTQNVDPTTYMFLTEDHWSQIEDYIRDPMTATWFNDNENMPKRKKEVVTNELIYYWMISQNIPMECQKWHLNRLLTLIRVCSIKNAPPKKIGKREAMNRNRARNEARRAKYHTKG